MAMWRFQIYHEWAQQESEVLFNTSREIQYLQVAM